MNSSKFTNDKFTYDKLTKTILRTEFTTEGVHAIMEAFVSRAQEKPVIVEDALKQMREFASQSKGAPCTCKCFPFGNDGDCPAPGCKLLVEKW